MHIIQDIGVINMSGLTFLYELGDKSLEFAQRSKNYCDIICRMFDLHSTEYANDRARRRAACFHIKMKQIHFVENINFISSKYPLSTRVPLNA